VESIFDAMDNISIQSLDILAKMVNGDETEGHEKLAVSKKST